MKNASEDTMNLDGDFHYEDLDDSQPRYEAYVCNRCGNPAHVAASRRRIVLWLLIVVLLIAVWVGFISLYMSQNVLESTKNKHKSSKNIVDQFKQSFTSREDLGLIHGSPHCSDRILARPQVHGLGPL
jgi:hypothetical protein